MSVEAPGRALLRGDLSGGLTAAVVALPLALAFGVSAFAPLGPEYGATGAMVGLLGCIFTGFFAAAFGGTPTQVTGPTGPMTVVITAFIAGIVQSHGINLPLISASLAIMIAVGGITEIGLGMLGGGTLVKFIPYPVVAGFMNGIAIIIALDQLKPALGMHHWADFSIDQAIAPAVVCALTVAVILGVRRFNGRIASLIGLAAGVLGYQLLAALDIVPSALASNALLIGQIPNPFQSLDAMQQLMPVGHAHTLLELPLPDIRNAMFAGLTLGLLGAIDSLLTSVVADNITRTRHDSKRELIGQGIGNIVSALGGGLAGAGATVRTLVNIGAGGRTRRSGMIHALAILLLVALFADFAAWIPLAALAGVLFVTAFGIVDRYSLALATRRKVRFEFAVMLIVTAITVLVDLISAVGIGCAIAAVLYVAQQVRQPVIFRRSAGNEIMSRTLRRQSDWDLLAQHGQHTLVYELRGSLFFGTTDAFGQAVERDLNLANHFVFDVSRVDDIDLTGTQVLSSVITQIKALGKTVALSGLQQLQDVTPFDAYALLNELGILDSVGSDHIYRSLDRALQADEEAALAALAPREHDPTHLLLLHEFEPFAELTLEERALFEPHLRERHLLAGEYLYRANETVDHLVLVRRGKLALIKTTASHEARLTTIGQGSLLGVRALLRHEDERIAGGTRAETDADVYLIARTVLQQLADSDPSTVLHLQRALLHSSMERIDMLMAEVALLEQR